MKDIITFSHFMERSNVTPIILKSVIGRNARIDRPNTVWTKPKKSEYNKSSLTNSPIMKLQQIANKYGINMDDCLEKNDMIDKILKNTPQAPIAPLGQQLPLQQLQQQLPLQQPLQQPQQLPPHLSQQRANITNIPGKYTTKYDFW